MRVGLSYGVSAREPLSRVPRVAAQVEAAGFDRLWFVDYQLPMKDSVVAMTLAATATKRLKLGPGVANPRTRHLSVLANAMNGIHEVSNGRALIGLGLGHTSVYGVGLRPATISEMETAIRALRGLVRGEEVNTDGKPYVLQTASVSPPPPVYVAATQLKTLYQAGRLGDGVILMGAADVEMTQWQLERIFEGLKQAGRSRRDIDIELWVTLSMGDGRSALRDIKAWAAAQARTLNSWRGELPAGLARFAAEFARADTNYTLSDHLSLRGRNCDLISDELAGRLAVAGDAETCARRLSELAKLGLDGITITLLSGGREQRISQMAEHLLPALR